MRLKPGQVALVAGAANGIGRALAQNLSARGLRLALVDLDAEALDAVARPLGALALPLNLTDRQALLGLPQRVAEALGPVDLLVDSAGVSLGGELVECSHEDVDWLMGVNLLAAMHLCKVFLPQLRSRPQAHIVTLASSFSLLPSPSKTAYCASKYGLMGFSLALRAELRGGPVSVTCVLPGAVATDIVQRSRVPNETLRAKEHRLLQEHGLAPETVAQRILEAVEADTARAIIGADARILSWINRLAPARLADWMGDYRHRLPYVAS